MKPPGAALVLEDCFRQYYAEMQWRCLNGEFLVAYQNVLQEKKIALNVCDACVLQKVVDTALYIGGKGVAVWKQSISQPAGIV